MVEVPKAYSLLALRNLSVDTDGRVHQSPGCDGANSFVPDIAKRRPTRSNRVSLHKQKGHTNTTGPS